MGLMAENQELFSKAKPRIRLITNDRALRESGTKPPFEGFSAISSQFSVKRTPRLNLKIKEREPQGRVTENRELITENFFRNEANRLRVFSYQFSVVSKENATA